MWQSLESSQTKDRPRPILGRITICSNQASSSKYVINLKYLDFVKTTFFSSFYGDWSSQDGQNPSTSVGQRSHSSLETSKVSEACSKTKVNRSQSFSDNGVKINMLLPPDPRYSYINCSQ